MTWTERVLNALMALFDLTPTEAALVFMCFMGIILGAFFVISNSWIKRLKEWSKLQREKLEEKEGK